MVFGGLVGRDMEQQTSTVARGSQEAGKSAFAAQRPFCQHLGDGTDGDGPDLHGHLARLSGFAEFGFVLQLEVQNRQAGRRVAQGAALDEARAQDQPVQACGAGAGARRCSSLSAAFIIGDGVVIALSRATVRWRSTASLKRKPVSSSFSVS